MSAALFSIYLVKHLYTKHRLAAVIRYIVGEKKFGIHYVFVRARHVLD